MNAPLNAKQRSLLRSLYLAAVPTVVYGRGHAETARALHIRDLIKSTASVSVLVMGELDRRPLWELTDEGRTVAMLIVAGGPS